MQWNRKKILVAIAALAILWLPLTHAEETETVLHWKNGDTLPGQLLESKSGKIHWSSPHFSDNLIVDVNVLDSIVFPKQSVSATEAFRIGTVSGDIWMADFIGSDLTINSSTDTFDKETRVDDQNTFLFSSKRHGQFRVNREMIYTLENREHSNLLFDGSQLADWKLPDQNKAMAHFCFPKMLNRVGMRTAVVVRRQIPLRRTSSTRSTGPRVLRSIWSWHLPRDLPVLFSRSAKTCTRQYGWKPGSTNSSSSKAHCLSLC